MNASGERRAGARGDEGGCGRSRLGGAQRNFHRLALSIGRMVATQTPQATLDCFTQLLRERNAESLASLYEPNALLVAPSGEILRGRPAIIALYTQMMTISPTLELTPHEMLVTESTAFVTNDWVLRGVAPDGTQIRTTGRSAVVLQRKADGSWRIAIDRP